ncbi:histidine utilization repressor [Methylobacterium terrae]|uniref:Histidine utilization repressor n=1 Tax=Methylobacterium terrae TaxID=2202827 RepID=A0A2U8WJ80_9HYPH|nr:UTRA domain-containing protein [Methylobacterium terrae]AWN46159.1 histidine utilization repressor [Methylobacterium terrae]
MSGPARPNRAGTGGETGARTPDAARGATSAPLAPGAPGSGATKGTTKGATKGATRHDHIVEDIRSRIVDGGWPPGSQLPVETELAERYGVSRMTMNKALGQLAREGFLIRRKKSGTQVAQPRAESAVVAIADIRDEVRRSGRAYRFRLIARRVRPGREEDALLLGGAAGSGEILWLQGVHLADDRPFCLETRLINPAVAEGAGGQDFTEIAPGAWLLEAVPWSVASHRVRAVNATASEAKLLELAVGEACLEIVRRTQAAGDWVTGVRLLYPGSEHQLVANFGPGSGDAPARG